MGEKPLPEQSETPRQKWRRPLWEARRDERAARAASPRANPSPDQSPRAPRSPRGESPRGASPRSPRGESPRTTSPRAKSPRDDRSALEEPGDDDGSEASSICSSPRGNKKS